MELVEILGYLAPAVLLVSFLMKNLNTLRLINSVGCLLFVAYGFLHEVPLWPVIISNGAIIFINFYYILKTKNA